MLFLFIIITVSTLLIRPLFAVEDEKFEPFASADDVLHFQTTQLSGINSSIESNYGLRLMNKNPPPWSPFVSYILGYAFFTSLPLAYDFTFENVNITAIHASASSSTYMEAGVGWFDFNGNAHFFLNNTKLLTAGATLSFVNFSISMDLHSGERFMVFVRIFSGQTYMQFYYGDEDHDSNVRYDGTAIYVPEFPKEFIFPMFLSITVLSILLKKKRLVRTSPKPCDE